MNCLITSAGRRVSLTKIFKHKLLQSAGKLIAGDCDVMSPALFFADSSILLPRIKAPDYVGFLLDYVQKNTIKLIIPTIDTELSVYAAAKQAFLDKGCLCLISSADFVEICSDKWNTYSFFSAQGVDVPHSWRDSADVPSAQTGQFIIKPRQGSASKDVFHTDYRGISQVIGNVDNPIIQECLEGPEITIDAYVSLDGQPKHYVPRLRIKAIGGESVVGRTIADAPIKDWIIDLLHLCAQHGAVGPLTLQAFLTERGPVLTEINPRFGGGFPLGYAAGGRYPDWIIDELHGESVETAFGKYKVGLCMARYYEEHFFKYEDCICKNS